MLKLMQCLEQVETMEAADFINYWNCKPTLLAMALDCSDDTVRRWCYSKKATSRIETPAPIKKAIAAIHRRMIENQLTHEDLVFFAKH